MWGGAKRREGGGDGDVQREEDQGLAVTSPSAPPPSVVAPHIINVVVCINSLSSANQRQGGR